MNPRTTREALMAELLGDVDGILDRLEKIHHQIAAAEERVTATTSALDNAGEKYRQAVTTFTEQAKIDLSEYLDLKIAQVAQVTAHILKEHRSSLQEAAHTAFKSEVSDKTAHLSLSLGDAIKELRHSRSAVLRMLEHAVTALIASGITASLVYTIIR